MATIGSLCSGYGGLDLAVEEFFGAETAWFSEFDAAPSKILANHWPDVPNLGDMTKIDWASVPKVDIVAGGTPCQDLSAAGRRKGMTEGTRSNLWVQMRECIAAVQPSIVIWENVRGAYSACADSDVGQCPRCMGKPGKHRPFLRALGRVLGDLSDLGFDAEVVGLRAADAGAPHARFRVFVVAYNQSDTGRFGNRNDGAIAYRDGARFSSFGRFNPGQRDADGRGREDTTRDSGEPAAPAADPGSEVVGLGAGLRASEPGRIGRGRPDNDTVQAAPLTRLLPTPAAHDSGNTPEEHLRKKPGRKVVTSLQVMADHGLIPAGGLLPTPSVADGTGGHARRGGDRGDELLLPGVAVALLPTPTTQDAANNGGPSQFDRNTLPLNTEVMTLDSGTWGPYAEAITRWEAVVGRPAPAPTLPDGKGGKHRLNARLVEWMMGIPAGWVTGESEQQWRSRLVARRTEARPVGMRGSVARWAPLTRNEQLKALGNGVVTQQAVLALDIAWGRILEAVAA